MSVLQVTNVRSNSTSFNTPVSFQTSGGTENGKLAKAWVNFNGTGTVAIRADFNVNTITDNGAGNYTVNFSNAMSDANYGFALSKSEAESEPIGYNATVSMIGISAGSIQIRIRYSNGVIGDDDYCCAAIFR